MSEESPGLTSTTGVGSGDAESRPDAIRDRVIAYYTAATADYRVWSRNYNMHFGYWRWGVNPFRREAMLQEMNAQTLSRLRLPLDRDTRLADLGGGAGATARVAVAAYPRLSVDVVTIAPVQVELGNRLNAAAARPGAISMHCADYRATGLPAGAYDAVCMIESACHSEGATKAGALREAFRLLRPGGHFVMVDALLRRPLPENTPLSRLVGRIYRRWCLSWAVPEMARLDLLPEALEAVGFERPVVEDWSWNVAPSVAHVPALASWFAIAEVVKAKGILPAWRWRHIVASALTPLLGLRRSAFAYAAVIARKPMASGPA